jgi:ankyrin repeat protein
MGQRYQDIFCETWVEDELFIECGEQGDLDAVQLLVDSFNPDLDAAQKDDGWTCIEVAAGYGHIKIVEFLLDCGVHVNKQDQDGWTALHAAAANGHLRVCQLLCERGADLNITSFDDEFDDPTYEGLTPAQLAVISGHEQVKKALDEFAGI